MDDTKNVIQSKTFWGIVTMVLGAVLGHTGFDATSLTGSEDLILTGLGAALGLYGRVKAVKRIK